MIAEPHINRQGKDCSQHCRPGIPAAGTPRPARREAEADGSVRILGTSTLVDYTPFYDEEGVEHHHNPNRFSFAMTCEAGHSWVARQYWHCCAQWPGAVVS